MVVNESGFAKGGDEPARHEGDEVGSGRDVPRLDIARHHQRDLPLYSLGLKPVIDRVGVLAADDDGYVPGIQESIAPLQPRTHRVPAPRRERIAVLQRVAGRRLRKADPRRRAADAGLETDGIFNDGCGRNGTVQPRLRQSCVSK